MRRRHAEDRAQVDVLKQEVRELEQQRDAARASAPTPAPSEPIVIDFSRPRFAVWLNSRGWLVDTDGSEARVAERLTSATTFATEEEADIALQAAARLDRYADSHDDVGSVVTL